MLYIALEIPFEINKYENLQNSGVNESDQTTLEEKYKPVLNETRHSTKFLFTIYYYILCTSYSKL